MPGLVNSTTQCSTAPFSIFASHSSDACGFTQSNLVIVPFKTNVFAKSYAVVPWCASIGMGPDRRPAAMARANSSEAFIRHLASEKMRIKDEILSGEYSFKSLVSNQFVGSCFPD